MSILSGFTTPGTFSVNIPSGYNRIDYLIVGGGGGGGREGGGGAGGFLEGTIS